MCTQFVNSGFIENVCLQGLTNTVNTSPFEDRIKVALLFSCSEEIITEVSGWLRLFDIQVNKWTNSLAFTLLACKLCLFFNIVKDNEV